MPARSETLLAIALLCLHLPAAADTPRWPTAQDMQQARKDHPFPDATQLLGAPAAPLPRVEASRPALDIAALARRLPTAPTGATRTTPLLRIFVTLDMPRSSLEQLGDQAGRTGAQLVLRGLKDGSMRRTLDALRQIIAAHPAAWVIDPPAFERFQVHQAPTFVLALDEPQDTPACRGGCAPTSSFARISGDVSLGFALEAMGRRRPDLARRIEPILQKLRETP